MDKYQNQMSKLGVQDVFGGEFKAATREDVAELEEEIGILLPCDYLEFLLNYGGLSVYSSCKIISSCQGNFYKVGDKIGIGIFLGGQLDIFPYTLIDYHRTYRDRIPFSLLTIATNTFGDLVCLSVKGDYQGCVYFLDAQEEEEVDEEEDEEYAYSNVYLLANSFVDFIHSLEEDD